jgi:PPOX class probable F420-dependent enzyme
MSDQIKQFEKQDYLNIETFRKNGMGVKTPVWFVLEGEMLYVWTETGSGKAKRICNNPNININPSKGDGTPLGEWMAASAIIDGSPEALGYIKKLFAQKYGLVFSLFGLLGKIRRAKYISVKIQVTG